MTDAQQRETKLLLDFASRTAEQFVSLYYAASDSPSRAQLVPTLYLPSSTIVWNGNPIQGAQGVAELVERMPLTRYEVQSFDCQPVGGGRADKDMSTPLTAPSLLVTVSGIVTHHTPSSHTALPPSNGPASSSNPGGTGGPSSSTGSGAKSKSSAGLDPSLPLESLPRAFGQNFVLANDPEGRGEGGVVVSMGAGSSGKGAANGGNAGPNAGGKLEGRFFVVADQFRFVG